MIVMIRCCVIDDDIIMTLLIYSIVIVSIVTIVLLLLLYSIDHYSIVIGIIDMMVLLTGIVIGGNYLVYSIVTAIAIILFGR